MNMVKRWGGNNKMSFLVNFSKEIGDWYRKTFGGEVGHLNIIPCTQRGRQ